MGFPIRIGNIFYHTRIQKFFTLSQVDVVSHSTVMVEACEAIQQHWYFVLAVVGFRYTPRENGDVPIEAPEREVARLELLAGFAVVRVFGVRPLVMVWVVWGGNGPEYRLRYAEMRLENSSDIADGQFELKFTIGVGEISRIEIINGNVVAVTLCWWIMSEFDLFAGKGFVNAEMFPI